MNFNLLLFWNYFFATMVIFCRNSLYSIISLVFLIVGACFILFSLNIEFLTFILLLIYIGAISVLFLFVVMMLQINTIEKQVSFNFNLSRYYLIYFIAILKFCSFLFYFNKKLCLSLSLFSFEYIKHNKDIESFSHFLLNNSNDTIIFLSLFSQKFLFFIIIGFTLLFSMVGSIALCLIKNK
uniref:NADH-ubiquinone oxidoreductase chain 6 n=1 Tax=Rhizaria sp. TaxID=2204297 RepID=A0A5P8DJU8_9EUKA|nr:NADH dehydrogenase subunit 6 [Rhizaria sp.]